MGDPTQEHVSLQIDFAVLHRDMEHVKDSLNKMVEQLSNNYVTKDIFEVRVGRIEKIIYGTLTALLLELLALVFVAVKGKLL